MHIHVTEEKFDHEYYTSPNEILVFMTDVKDSKNKSIMKTLVNLSKEIKKVQCVTFDWNPKSQFCTEKKIKNKNHAYKVCDKIITETIKEPNETNLRKAIESMFMMRKVGSKFRMHLFEEGKK